MNLTWILEQAILAGQYMVLILITPRQHRDPYIPKRKRRTSDWLCVRIKALFDCCFEAITSPILNMKTKRKERMHYRHNCNQRKVGNRTRSQKGLGPSRLDSGLMKRVCYTSPNSEDSGAIPFDTDSFQILIHNCCSACITNNLNDFEGKPVKVNARVKGVGGAINLSHKGTVRWSIQDDEGRSHTFLIKDSFYARNAPCRLLSPQHWSQNATDNTARSKGTWSATYNDKVEETGDDMGHFLHRMNLL